MSPQARIDAFTSQGIARRLSAPAAMAPRLELGADAQDPADRAAVLLPLYQQRSGWHLLYIRRAEHPGDRHSGEVAFPGGRCELGEHDPGATALREAHEEIGLDPASVDILGTLAPFLTVSGFLVTPVVGEIPWPLVLTPEPSEVARVFSIPLAWLADPANRRIRLWPSPDHSEARPVVFFDPYDGEHLWGVSAAITLDLLGRLGAG